MCVCVCVCVCMHAQSCPTLCDPMDCSPPGSSSIGFSRQESWSELPFPSPGDLPDPGFEPESPMAAALTGTFFTTEPPRVGSATFSSILFLLHMKKREGM